MTWDSIINGLFTLAVAYLAYRLRENTIHINSRMDKVIEEVRVAALARGNLEGRAEAKDEQRNREGE